MLLNAYWTFMRLMKDKTMITTKTKERILIAMPDDLLEYLQMELKQVSAVTGHPKAKMFLEMIRFELGKRED